MTRRLIIILITISPIFLAGCPKTQRPIVSPEPLTLDDTIQAYQANIAAIPAFKASLDKWYAKWYDPKTDRQHSHKDLSGKMFYQPSTTPDQNPRLYLQADTAFLTRAFVIGANQDEFFIYSRAAHSGAWGTFANIDQPCSIRPIIHPHDFLRFLGLLNPAPSSDYQPVYRITPTESIIEYVYITPDQLQLAHEIIFPRGSHLPSSMNIFDAEGNVVLHTEIKNYLPLGNAQIPTDISFQLSDKQSQLNLKLRALKEDSTPERRQPLFERPEQVPDVDSFLQLDEKCQP